MIENYTINTNSLLTAKFVYTLISINAIFHGNQFSKFLEKKVINFSALKFPSTLYKGWQSPEAEPLVAARRQRNSPCRRALRKG